MGEIINLKHGTFKFDDRGEDYPLGKWNLEELGTDVIAVNPFWARSHPKDAFWFAVNGHFLPVDAGLFCKPDFDSGSYNVYELMDHEESIFYIGQSTSLQKRFRTHMMQPYGENIEYALFAKCKNHESMDLLESTLVTGFGPELNKAMMQFYDPLMESDAIEMHDRFEWNVAWGVGTMFWSTSKICDHIRRGLGPGSPSHTGSIINAAIQKSSLDMSFNESLRALENISSRDIAVHTMHDLRWCTSFAFMFDVEALLTFADDIKKHIVECAASMRK